MKTAASRSSMRSFGAKNSSLADRAGRRRADRPDSRNGARKSGGCAIHLPVCQSFPPCWRNHPIRSCRRKTAMRPISCRQALNSSSAECASRCSIWAIICARVSPRTATMNGNKNLSRYAAFNARRAANSSGVQQSRPAPACSLRDEPLSCRPARAGPRVPDARVSTPVVPRGPRPRQSLPSSHAARPATGTAAPSMRAAQPRANSRRCRREPQRTPPGPSYRLPDRNCHDGAR